MDNKIKIFLSIITIVLIACLTIGVLFATSTISVVKRNNNNNKTRIL